MGRRLSDSQYRIEPLNTSHDRATFSCGEATLDRYIRQSAGQDMRRRVTVVYVLVDAAAPRTIAGFYTLSASSVSLHDFPLEMARQLPKYPLVPVALVGRLASSLHCQGQGCGALLIVDALARSCAISETGMGVAAVVVDAKTEQVTAFYEKYGFIRFHGTTPPRLFIPIRTAQQALSPGPTAD